MKKPDLGKDYSGIDTVAMVVNDIRLDYGESYFADICDYVLWILQDYKRLKMQESDTE